MIFPFAKEDCGILNSIEEGGNLMHQIVDSTENYLEAIYMLSQKKDCVRAIDIVHHLDLSKPSVSIALKKMVGEEFILVDEKNCIHLLDSGLEIAKRIYEKHLFFIQLLEAAGVDPKNAEEDACKLEHAISDESFHLLKNYIRQGE